MKSAVTIDYISLNIDIQVIVNVYTLYKRLCVYII